MTVKVKVKNLTKVFGKNPKNILDKVKNGATKGDILKETGYTVGVNKACFEVNEGEIFAIMGLSGSGKSTLIRCLNLLNIPTEGEIYVDGENILEFDKEKLREFRQSKIAMVFQHFGLFSHRTIIENVAYGLEIGKMDKRKRREAANKALVSVGLEGWDDKYPHELSGGMQQRVGLARALASDPDILLMDEPFSALDPLIRRDMQLELLELQAKLKKTIIFITHDINEAFKLGDRIAIMKDGVIDQIGTPQQILDSPVNDYVEAFVKDIDKTKILKAKNIMEEPGALVSIQDNLDKVIHGMKSKEVTNAFVIDSNKKFKGIVTNHEVMKAVNEKKSIKEILIKDYHTVTPEMHIQKFLGIITSAKYPIAVLDENEAVLGSIGLNSVVSALV